MLNPFVELAFGKQYLFQREIVLVLCINFFVNGTRKAVLIFKESMGLFWYDRYKAIAEAVLNLGISILLVTHFGVVGVLPEPSVAQCSRPYGWSLTSFIDIVSRNRFGSISEGTVCILSLWLLRGQLQNFAAR